MQKKTVSILLIIGIILAINFLSNEFFLRFDTTKDKTYTLSKATKDILRNLEDPITVTSYFTGNLPPQYAKTLNDFKDLLKEYNTRSKGMVNFEFVDPNKDPAKEQEAVQSGIQPLLINVREKDEVVQKKAFMGASIKRGESTELLPFIAPEGPMEYQLTTAIKKLAVLDKPSIGFLQGHGEPKLADIAQVNEALSVLYNIENVDLSTGEEIPPRFKTVVILNPQDSFVSPDLELLDRYLGGGGNIVLAFNAVSGDFQTVSGNALQIGLVEWLQEKGINILYNFVLDASSGSIGVQQRQGMFTFNTQVQFPFFPNVSNFNEHPITQGIDQVIFPFASPIDMIGAGTLSFTPLVQTSEKSATQSPPVTFDVQRQWRATDFPLGRQTIGALVEGDFGNSGLQSRMVIFTDGDFVAAGGRGMSNADNYSLLVNSVDFLSDDTGLIDLRTKGVSSRPIKDLEDSKKTMYKWANFIIPILFVVILGIIRNQRNRNKRIRRLQETYV